jgi:hypothetical protein
MFNVFLKVGPYGWFFAATVAARNPFFDFSRLTVGLAGVMRADFLITFSHLTVAFLPPRWRQRNLCYRKAR